MSSRSSFTSQTEGLCHKISKGLNITYLLYLLCKSNQIHGIPHPVSLVGTNQHHSTRVTAGLHQCDCNINIFIFYSVYCIYIHFCEDDEKS